MAHYIEFTNDKTGAQKRVKVGFSWVLLLFSGAWGIPLFLRGLHKYGSMMLAYSLIAMFIDLVSEELSHALATPIMGLGIGLTGMFGWYSNQLNAKHLLETGWSVSNSEEPATTAALEKWSLA